MRPDVRPAFPHYFTTTFLIVPLFILMILTPLCESFIALPSMAYRFISVALSVSTLVRFIGSSGYYYDFLRISSCWSVRMNSNVLLSTITMIFYIKHSIRIRYFTRNGVLERDILHNNAAICSIVGKGLHGHSALNNLLNKLRFHMIIAVFISFLKTNKFHLIIHKRYRQRERYHIIIRKFAQSN